MATLTRSAFGTALLVLSLSTAQAGVVTDHGRLKAQGNQIVDTNGVPFQVAGMSLYWSIWGGQNYYNRNVVDTLSQGWNATVVRAATAGTRNGTGADKGFMYDSAGTVAKAKAVIDAAIADDIYVIVDWHEDSANNYKHWDRAYNYFSVIAQAYGDKPNVIFEIWNEPQSIKWDTVRNYATRVLPAIRQFSNNLVVVGTTTWSQDVDTAAKRPVSDPNVAYTLHFYACTHGHSLIKRANNARAAGIPLFITEFGLSPSDGGSPAKNNYRICTDSATFWLDWADSNQISWANWSLSDKGESSAAIDSTNKDYTGNWPDNALSASGKWIKARLRARTTPSSVRRVSDAAGFLPSFGASAEGLEIRLPQGTRRAELIDLAGRILSTSSSDRLPLPGRVSGVHWVRWTDATGLHSASIAMP
jgi:endoglucanase